MRASECWIFGLSEARWIFALKREEPSHPWCNAEVGLDGLLESVAECLGDAVVRATTVAGGDINDAYALDLAGGRRVFLKTHAQAPSDMFDTEARGLRWLSEARALRVPEVLAVGDADGQSFLLLEWLESERRGPAFDQALGRGLAALHRFGASRFGLDHDNYIGRLPQLNTPSDSWAEFYVECRLRPMIVNWPELHADFEWLFGEIEQRVGPPEAPSRLHGDLWSGNLHAAGTHPALIDPAVYGGHREVDLAMMRLFGGFSDRVFAAYEEAFPLAPASDERIPLYQLYPLLVHLNLFGVGYLRAVKSALARCL